MKIKEILSESNDSVTLYHGTCPESAKILMTVGWSPRTSGQGANMGQSRYLYLTSDPEDALWFAKEKGCGTVLKVSGVPMASLRVDPEDGVADTVYDELHSSMGLPGKVVAFMPLSKEHFSIQQ
jgi:hypothetical protein